MAIGNDWGNMESCNELDTKKQSSGISECRAKSHTCSLEETCDEEKSPVHPSPMVFDFEGGGCDAADGSDTAADIAPSQNPTSRGRRSID
jgi:hypothetical protein